LKLNRYFIEIKDRSYFEMKYFNFMPKVMPKVMPKNWKLVIYLLNLVLSLRVRWWNMGVF